MYTLHFRHAVCAGCAIVVARHPLEFRSQIEQPHFHICTTCGSSFPNTHKCSFLSFDPQSEIRAVAALGALSCLNVVEGLR